jgi:Fe-Mn family superoxide dismutase
MENNYQLLPLPYDYNALEPHISAEIMTLHHDKHHAAYVKNLNDAIAKHLEIFTENPEDVLKNLNDVPEDIRMAVRNNGGGHVNHSMFWQIMKPDGGGEPMGELAEEITKHFGSFKDFQEKFNDGGLKRFGSGWVWLVKNKNGGLEVISTANQDNPISDGLIPIMGNDVWEHAYYLQYKSSRADYLKAWWNVVNWDSIAKNFKAA